MNLPSIKPPKLSSTQSRHAVSINPQPSSTLTSTSGLVPSTSSSSAHQTTLDDTNDDSDDSDELSRPTTARLLSTGDTPFSQQASIHNRLPWSEVVDPDEEEDLWGADTGREAAGADERVLARVPSISVINAASSSLFDRSTATPPPLPPPSIPPSFIHTAATLPVSPTEEWRSKILESVRKGEEKVAQRRKASLASIDFNLASNLATSTSNPHSIPFSQQSPFSQQTSALVPSHSSHPHPSTASTFQPEPASDSVLEILETRPPDSSSPSKGKQRSNSPSPPEHPHVSSAAPTPPPVPSTPSVSPSFVSAASNQPSPSPPRPSKQEPLPSTKTYSANNPFLGLLNFDSSEFSHELGSGLLGRSLEFPSTSDPPFASNAPQLLPSILSASSSQPSHSLGQHHPPPPRDGHSSPHTLHVDTTPVTRTNSYTPSGANLGITTNQDIDSRWRPASWIPSNSILSDDPPPSVTDGTFLSVTDPRSIPSRTNQGHANDEPTSRVTLGPITDVTMSPPTNVEESPILSFPSVRPISPSRIKTSKRNFFSTLLHRASGGSASNPGSPGTSLMANGLRSTNDHGSNHPSTPQLYPSPRLNPLSSVSNPQRRLSRSFSDSTHGIRPQIPAPSAPVFANTHNLKSMGLQLTPLTPFLPISRNAHPLCGAILDNKYLLIGTNYGLDFVPLPHVIQSRARADAHGSSNSIGTVKPMTLIKKTRFKSLKVLEVRSNILLAIAGRNDHLRVYALDGIRAIVAKKMQELEDKDDFVWLPKQGDHDPQSGQFKGKGKATTIRTNNTNPTSSPVYSPPPAYGLDVDMTKSHSIEANNHPAGNHRTGSLALTTALRRSSTLGTAHNKQRNQSNGLPDQRRSSFHSAATLSPLQSPVGRLQRTHLSTPAATVIEDNRPQLDSLQLVLDPVELGLEREIEMARPGPQDTAPIISAHLTSQDDSPINRHEGYRSISSNSTDADRVEQTTDESGPNATATTALSDRVGTKVNHKLTVASGEDSDQSSGIPNPPNPDLIDLIRLHKSQSMSPKPSQTLSPTLVTSRSNTLPRVSRPVPRSSLIGDTDEESVDANEDEGVRRASKRLTLLDIISQAPPPSVTPAPSPYTPSRAAAAGSSRVVADEVNSPSELEAAPRSIQPHAKPRTLSKLAEPRPQDNGIRTIREGSGSNALLNVPLAPASGRATSSGPLNLSPNPSASAPGTPQLMFDGDPNPPANPHPTPKSKKRWSMMDSVFRTYNNNAGSASGSSPTLAPSRTETNSHTSSDFEFVERPHSSGNNRHASYQPPLSETQNDSIQLADSVLRGPVPAPPQVIRSRASTQKIRPHMSQSAGSYLASGVSGGLHRTPHDFGDGAIDGSSRSPGFSGPQNAIVGNSDDQPRERLATHHHGHPSIDPKTSPHPATLGAPLEYVKLARTKGAKLLRAFETKRRTYLAVLCGEASERIELFTGSKNISLSLNRTFVLPETPRTIEFQMQGDDLVDIYLVYDESVFALEPATVRVREVGIGRNERRAARRERERAARDLASTNLRPPVTATGSTTNLLHGLPLSVSLQPQRSESLGMHPIISNIPTPSAVDEGLTLSVPPSASSTARHGGNPNVVGVVTVANAMGGNWGGGDGTLGGSNGAKPINLWPYTTFQQLQAIPPLPPSVLASTFVIPPTYEAVVSASGGPKPPPALSHHMTPSHSTNSAAHWTNEPAGEPTESALKLELSLPNPAADVDSEPGHGGTFRSSLTLDEPGLVENDASSRGLIEEGPLLSPISLLAHPANRHIGPPGLFLVSRGKKLTSIVDCDGRSVMKKPFVWTNDRNAKPSATDTGGGLRIEVIVVDNSRTMLVGVGGCEVKVFEVGGVPAPGLEEYSNSGTVEVVPELYESGGIVGSGGMGGGNGVGVITSESLYGFANPHHPSSISSSSIHFGSGSGSVREIVYLGASEEKNLVIWSERRGNSFGVYCLEAI